jgi:restriction system protein
MADKPWKDYQEEAAEFFRSLGLEATTDATVKGVRTSHDVDVLVKSTHVGFDVTWIVECKQWKSRVSKLHVLALREIVQDLGADRGIVLSESGFQSGAHEAAGLTNVQLASLSELRGTTEQVVGAMRLRDLFDRLNVCSVRYWDMPKDDRIEAGLRPEVGVYGYSGNVVIDLCKEMLTRAMQGQFPVRCEDFRMMVLDKEDRVFDSAVEAADWVEFHLAELEAKLDEASPADDV